MSGNHQKKSIAEAVPAATILLLRDGTDGLEVLMVKRHHELEFGGGALVFPGGRTARSDYDPDLAGLVDGATDWPTEFRAFAIAAIREAFEEAGVLLARDASCGELIDAAKLAALDEFREELEQERVSLLTFLRQHNLRLACDRLVPFAHWITPRNMPKRFDTHFFLARAPLDHAGSHCGRESVASLWARPHNALASDAPGKLMFPTRLNLMKLAHAANVEDAFSAARAVPPVAVEPWIERMPGGNFVRIREDAGYEITRIPEHEMM
jgi:8-oxo-dGTP pyrophosphatase MutT (NUDIX family)